MSKRKLSHKCRKRLCKNTHRCEPIFPNFRWFFFLFCWSRVIFCQVKVTKPWRHYAFFVVVYWFCVGILLVQDLFWNKTMLVLCEATTKTVSIEFVDPHFGINGFNISSPCSNLKFYDAVGQLVKDIKKSKLNQLIQFEKINILYAMH